jgi:hypothetical protein
METYTKEQQQYLDKINELLATREAKQDNLRQLNRTLMQGFALLKTMPIRWYVKDNGQKEFEKVLDYLSKKHKRKIINCGYGELHGEYAFVPPDVQYSWEITLDEFNYLLSVTKK